MCNPLADINLMSTCGTPLQKLINLVSTCGTPLQKLTFQHCVKFVVHILPLMKIFPNFPSHDKDSLIPQLSPCS